MEFKFTEEQIRKAAKLVGGFNHFTKLLQIAEQYKQLNLVPVFIYHLGDGTLELRYEEIPN